MTELGVEVVEASGAVQLVTLGVSASVATEAVANRSSWGAVPPGRPCAEATLDEYAAPQVRAVLGLQTLSSGPDPGPDLDPNPGSNPEPNPDPRLHSPTPPPPPGACRGGAAAASAAQLVRL